MTVSAKVDGMLIVTLAVDVHNLLSVTVTVYVPAPKPDMLEVVRPPVHE